jgi:hypothetical protein
MKKLTNSALALLVVFLVLAASTLSFAQNPSQVENEGESVLVGRISHVEGSVLRYIPDEREWERTVRDTPFGLEDKLRTDSGARVEVILPNNTWFRINEASLVELVSLRNDRTEMHMAYGEARFLNKGSDAEMIVTTPFGHVTSPGQASFDLYVSDASVEVVPLKGSMFFTHENDRSRHEVMAGSSSLIADEGSVAAGTGDRDSQWDAWNADRDNLWARRMRGSGPSAKYLPPQIDDQAYVLEDYGVWDRVYYNGHYGHLWRPLHVGVEWSPFSVGRWAVWYGDEVWIPGEPFGYVTHHYGNWVYVGRYWYWAPPAVAVGVHVSHPGLSISFGWYPGRVAWVHSDIHIGWVPLAPHETYYSRRHWGPRTVVVKDVHVTNVHVHNYTNISRTVVVKNDRFYRVDSYKNHRVRDIDQKTIVNQYRAAPVVDRKMVAEKGRERYSFSPREREKRGEGVSVRGGSARPGAAREEKLDSRSMGSDGQSERRRESGGSRSIPSRMEGKATVEGDQPGKSQMQRDRVEDKGRSDAVKREGAASERRSVDDPGGSGKVRSGSGAGEVQRPSTGETQRPSAREIQRPSAGQIQGPSGGEVQRPSTGETQRPSAGEIQRPSGGEIQRPGTGPAGDRIKGALGGDSSRPGESDRNIRRNLRGNSPGTPQKNEQISPEKQGKPAPDDRRSGPLRAPNQDRQVRPERTLN